MKPRRTNVLTTVLAVAIGAVALFLALRGTDLDATSDALARARLAPFVACLLALFASYALRAVRWHVLLQSSEQPVSLLATYEASSVGYLLNNVLPARAGDVFRSVALKRRAGVSRSFGFATTMAERSGDVLWLAVLTLLLGSTSERVPSWLSNAASIMMVVAATTVIALSIGYRGRKTLVRTVRKWHLGGHAARIEHIIRNAGNGLAVLGQPTRAVKFIALTAVIWLIDALSLIAAVGSVTGPITLDESLLVLCALGLASAAPSTPGYVGLFQLVAVSVMPAFGVARPDALAAIVVFQVAILIEVLLAGSVAAMRLRAAVPADTADHGIEYHSQRGSPTGTDTSNLSAGTAPGRTE